MGKKEIKWRVYPAEFKTEAVALVEKGEKPVNQIVQDLGINESMLRRWVQRAHSTVGTAERTFPGHGRLRDEEMTRLRKENKALREASD